MVSPPSAHYNKKALYSRKVMLPDGIGGELSKPPPPERRSQGLSLIGVPARARQLRATYDTGRWRAQPDLHRLRITARVSVFDALILSAFPAEGGEEQEFSFGAGFKPPAGLVALLFRECPTETDLR